MLTWSRATSWMARARKHGSPLTYVQDLVKAKLHTALSHEGTSNILVGDLNASRVGNGGTHSRLADWMSEAILSSGVTEEVERNSFTRWSGPSRPTGHIDHVLHSPDRELTLSITKILDDSMWFGITDHRPVQAAFKLDGGAPDSTPTRAVVYPVDLELKDKAQLEEFRATLTEMWQSVPQPTADATMVELSGLLRRMSETLYAAAETAVGKPRKFPPKFKDGWSPTYIAMKAQLTALTEIRRHLLGEHRRPKWDATYIAAGITREVNKWLECTATLRCETAAEREALLNFIPDHGPVYWKTVEVGNIPTLTDTCSKDMSKLLTMMHGRQRSEHRSKISASVAARERLLQEGKLGKVIKSIMGTERGRFDYGVLSTADGIITDPTQIHNKVASHFQDWFAGPASDHGGIHAATTDWKTVFSDREAVFEHGRR